MYRTCSKPAVGHMTTVEVDVAGELFNTLGLMITEHNWLEVYPWEKWGGNADLPTFHVGPLHSIPNYIALMTLAIQ